MENMAPRVEIHVQRLPEGIYLATSPDVPGLTVEAETREAVQRAASDVALDLMEEERGGALPERPIFSFKYSD
jgi:predicted RNase H-like HicB family nuclease